jgi:putative FmdB family regulatory protein
MPLYEYECAACGQRFELIRKFSDPPVDVCTLCGQGPVNRLQSSPAIQFKGSGWYITDYSQKGKPEGAAKSQNEKTGTADAASSETPKTETKSDTAAKPESSTAAAPAKTGGAAKKD